MNYSHTVCTCWAISPMYVQYTLNKPFKWAPFWWSCLTSHHHVLLNFLKGFEVTLVALRLENHSSVSLLCHQTRSCCRYWEKKLTAQLRKFLRENKSNKIIEISHKPHWLIESYQLLFYLMNRHCAKEEILRCMKLGVLSYFWALSKRVQIASMPPGRPSQTFLI